MTPAPSEPQKTTNSQHTSIPKSHFGHDHERAQTNRRGESVPKPNKTKPFNMPRDNTSEFWPR